MRVQILALSAVILGGPSFAGSISDVKQGTTDNSIEHVTCVRCVTVTTAKKVELPTLAPGTQRVEIREVNGERKIFRTEAWMGGSPVVFVTKAPESVDNDVADNETTPEQPAQAIALDETTSAVTADVGATMKVEPKPALDPASLQLRLN